MISGIFDGTDPYVNLTVVATDHGTPPLSSNTTVYLSVQDQDEDIPQFDTPVYNIKIEEHPRIGSPCSFLTSCGLHNAD